MLQTCRFLKEHASQKLLRPTLQSNGRVLIRLEEADRSAAVIRFDLLVPSNEELDFYVFKIPEDLEFKKIFPDYNYSCDFILFHASNRIVMLIELKGDKTAYAKKQIKYTEPFINYILRLVEIEENIKIPKYRVKRLIISYRKHRRKNTNVGNGYFKETDKIWTVLKVPSPCCRYEWNDLL